MIEVERPEVEDPARLLSAILLEWAASTVRRKDELPASTGTVLKNRRFAGLFEGEISPSAARILRLGGLRMDEGETPRLTEAAGESFARSAASMKDLRGSSERG